MNALVPLPPRRGLKLRDVAIAILTWFAADSLAGLVILAVGAVLVVRSGKKPIEAITMLPDDPIFVTTTIVVGLLIAATIIRRLVRRSRANTMGHEKEQQ